MPLLVSFVLPPLAVYRWLSVMMIFAAAWLNNVYPAFILLEDNQIKVKNTLSFAWHSYHLEKLTITIEKNYLCLQTDSQYYRLSMTRLSVRLYQELLPFINLSKCIKQWRLADTKNETPLILIFTGKHSCG